MVSFNTHNISYVKLKQPHSTTRSTNITQYKAVTMSEPQTKTKTGKNHKNEYLKNQNQNDLLVLLWSFHSFMQLFDYSYLHYSRISFPNTLLGFIRNFTKFLNFHLATMIFPMVGPF